METLSDHIETYEAGEWKAIPVENVKSFIEQLKAAEPRTWFAAKQLINKLVGDKLT